ncbi:cation diffusion facilitator family transporter [Aureimonas pseudogalii]|uniref:Cobalt-zinc-cadmium efflux system protein n=1 Tax=Aureimonas pseudogalii TaxID=1744844 RepID=A0A7W6ED62_9HYPH|nr:cation diffusion facilitator family transporter [Aureimonas pseudogalii]MBB3996495.1 cobalt-zinc-cadmium efflux system protein [Aureimonas pseudogalii]
MASSHEHSHDHSGHGHHDHGADGHDHTANAGEGRLAIAAGLTGLFMLAEVAGGLVSGSLALLADAGHMLVDFAGLALAWFAIRMARRPADARRTYGYDRFQILVAYSNGLVLFGISAVILYEAWHRLTNPVEVLGGTMLAVALGGLLVNVVAFFVLHGGDREDLNMRGALLHVMGDLLGSVAAIVASLVILWTGWTPIDPILSVFVCLLILGNAYRLIRESGHILLEGAPADVEAGTIESRLAGISGLAGIHHVHVWMLTPKRRAATLHASLHDEADGTAVVRAIKSELRASFAIVHATVEVERVGDCADASAHDDHDHAADAARGSACLHSPPPGRHDHDHGHDHGPVGGHASAALPRPA